MKKIDMTGWVMSEHGVPDSKLTVIEEAEPHITKSGIKQVQWKCKCECGKEVIIKGQYLRTGNTKSCGCLATQKLIQRNIDNGKTIQIGDIFGKLTVIADLGMRKQKSRDKNWRWSLCQCECGSDPIEAPKLFNEFLSFSFSYSFSMKYLRPSFALVVEVYSGVVSVSKNSVVTFVDSNLYLLK